MAEPLSPAWKQNLRRRLLSWFSQNARDLPWRKTRDPYQIWVSEIMLQQTQVATVIPYFERFIGEFPDVASLAGSDEQRVLRLWEGLGYYRRARQMHAAAKVVVEKFNGRFPETLPEVLSLPGIGRYTAGAILSISLDAKHPILEANTIRLLSRLRAYRDDPLSTAGQSFLWQMAEDILPNKQAGQFNQALMELGSQVCKPREPLCDSCPLQTLCPTFALGLQEQIPQAKKKTNYEDVTEVAVVIRRDQQVLIRLCSENERWAGLWDFPRFALPLSIKRGHDAEIEKRAAAFTQLKLELGERFTTIKHGVTRFRITLHCYEANWLQGSIATDDTMRWVSPADLEGVPLSVTGRKIAQQLLKPQPSVRQKKLFSA